MQPVWGLHLDNHCSGDSAQSIHWGWGVSPSIHKQHPCLLNLAEISGHLPNIYHLFFPSWTPVLLTTTYPGSRTLHLQTPFRYRCPHDLVSPMKCTWTHWISLLGKSNKGGWSIVALSESSTNNFVYHKLPFLLPFFPIMWAWCWRSFSHLGTTGSKQMLGILERTKVPESMMT